MKKRIPIFLSFLCASLLNAAPKIATIDAGKVIGSYHMVKNDVESYKSAKLELSKDPRKAALDEMAKKIREIKKKISEVREGSDEFNQLRQEEGDLIAGYNDLRYKWSQYSRSKLRALTETFVDATAKRNDEILKVARNIGDSEGFDWILETSGKTNSTMPLALYIRKSVDITDKVIAELSKNAPSASEGTDSEQAE